MEEDVVNLLAVEGCIRRDDTEGARSATDWLSVGEKDGKR